MSDRSTVAGREIAKIFDSLLALFKAGILHRVADSIFFCEFLLRLSRATLCQKYLALQIPRKLKKNVILK